MAEARYVVRDTAGQEVAGDDVFDDWLKIEAGRVSGYVVDTRTGETVYNATPGSGLDLSITV
ncbi:hypothetical protein QDW23_gp62 [Microbacterium phage Stromboli]|uniref:hypothetical protein n=1 Tax=Microbacterium Phage DirtyBubble TaxID=2590932 RepID=UPI00118D044A|nr:hypothetical protein QDW22_gp62 [Microbacterium Phage DirtyBubble]YP_010752726.1 hypothetical protein QDW23_gp62 [Microbacterium phage Stromboli]QDP45080.1 hypothetical protein DIRTYBUBBLE_62 [Microbacterium Phage DirtyBubble]QIN93721.1 hypothetical protein SEA_STROMBOLI_62 [Microbacterium phage Stromboli]QTF81996.1 hypothetical protein SEA_BABYYODA_62 [Microbacterium phage BabyYoda]